MKQLISCVVLGCTLLVPGLAAQRKYSKPKAAAVPEYDSSQWEAVAAMEAMGDETNEVVESQAPASATDCCEFKKRPWTKWTQILAAPKTQCGLYTFVQSAICSADELCASLGLSVPTHCKVHDEVQCCATKCGFKCAEKKHTPCGPCHTDSSEDEREDSSSMNEKSKCESNAWKHGCKPATLCIQPKCGNCQAPQLLTFDDGTDQTCYFFVLDGSAEGYCTKYRGFSIENGGVFDPWANRCDCTFMSTLTSVVSQQKVLTNSKSGAPMVFSRKQPFTLLSMFVAFSSDKATMGTVKISVFKGGKYTKPDTLKLKAGVPTLYKKATPISDIEKIRFDFGDGPGYKFVNVDNMLLCM